MIKPVVSEFDTKENLFFKFSIPSLGWPKFFEHHSPAAVVKPSGSSHNRNIEVFFPGNERCVRFLNRTKGNLMHLHTQKYFASAQLHPKFLLIQTDW